MRVLVWLSRARRSQAGFSVVEMLVVLALLAVLSTVVLPTMAMVAERQREVELKRDLWQIRDALDAYHAMAAQGAIPTNDGLFGYPASLNALVEGVADQRPGHAGERLAFLRRVPRDPFADAASTAEDGWSLRDYESPANAPKAGRSVYDVHSKSSALALDGTAVKDW